MHAETGDRTRLLVLGLDGLTLDTARFLASAAPAPHLGRLTELPGATTLRAELPELSPVNWTSLWTAATPGEHGVYGFSVLDPTTYATRVVTSADARTPSIFHRLAATGRSSAVVNLPNTWPADTFADANMRLVAGFVAQDWARAVYPPPVAYVLGAQGYAVEPDTSHAADADADPRVLLADLTGSLAHRRTALELFWPDMRPDMGTAHMTPAWDLFMLVLTETDRLFHFLHHAVTDATHPLHADCMALVRALDELVGEVLARYDRLPEPKGLLAVADHGFAPLRTEVDVNAWLVREGYLHLQDVPGPVPAGGAAWDARRVGGTSRAFALDPARVYLHDARFARGPVQPHEHEGLLDAIRNGLAGLTYQGEPVFAAVHRGDELYHGPQAQGASGLVPDLVCEPAAGFSPTAKFDSRDLFGQHGRTGAHGVKGALFCTDFPPPRTPRTLAPTLSHAGRTILDFFNIPS